MGPSGADTAPAYLAIGRIGRAHGVRGEVRVEVLTDFPSERFVPGAEVWIGTAGAGDLAPTTIASVRPHHATLLIRFAASDDRDSGRELTGKFVYVASSDARPLADDEFYFHELVGLEAVTAEGDVIGHVTSVIETGSADVVVIRGTAKEYLVPLIKDAVAAVDLAQHRLVIRPMPGLLD